MRRDALLQQGDFANAADDLAKNHSLARGHIAAADVGRAGAEVSRDVASAAHLLLDHPRDGLDALTRAGTVVAVCTLDLRGCFEVAVEARETLSSAELQQHRLRLFSWAAGPARDVNSPAGTLVKRPGDTCDGVLYASAELHSWFLGVVGAVSVARLRRASERQRENRHGSQ